MSRCLLSSTCLRRLRSSSKQKVVVIMGATGTGKSKLSIDLSLRLSPLPEIINSDKIQVYSGLDLTTNKVSPHDLSSVRHHLLGNLDPSDGELSPVGFRSLGRQAISEIFSRNRLPIITGGSISFIRALLLRDDVSESADFDYETCLVWVHVDGGILAESLDRRVEEMVERGMVAELAAAYDPGRRKRGYVALWRAIGVEEFDRCFETGGGVAAEKAAVAAIKESTRRLAAVQEEKIRGLVAAGWRVRKVDATAAVAAAMERRENFTAGERRENIAAAEVLERKEKVAAVERRESTTTEVWKRREKVAAEERREKVAAELWEKEVVGPTLAAVEQFLERESEEEMLAKETEFLEREREEETVAAAEGIGRMRVGELLG